MALVVPQALARAVEAEPSPARLLWLSRLADTVTVLADRWDLSVGTPFEPGGTTAWVAPARDASGRDLVLKVGWAHDEAEQEADGLRAWGGHGAVRIHDSCRFEQTAALLLERCHPGTPLRVVPEVEQDEVIAGLLARLWQAPAAGFTFRPLQEMCRLWVRGFHRRVADAPAGGPPGGPRPARGGDAAVCAPPPPPPQGRPVCSGPP